MLSVNIECTQKTLKISNSPSRKRAYLSAARLGSQTLQNPSSTDINMDPRFIESPSYHTTLTPSMDRLFSREHKDEVNDEKAGTGQRGAKFFGSATHPCAPPVTISVNANQVRSMVQNCLKNGIANSACTLADRLLRLPDSTVSDVVLFARCFQCAGEPQRCLAALEHKGMLAAQIIADLGELLSPKARVSLGDLQVPTFFMEYLGKWSILCFMSYFHAVCAHAII